MPAQTPHGFPYPLPTEPVAEGAQRIRELAEAIDPGGRPRGRLTPAQFRALSGVLDGDLADVVIDAANGVVWRFRYNAGSSSARKWEFVDGRPLVAEQSADHVLNSGSYVAATGIVIPPVPLAADLTFVVSYAAFYGGTVGWAAFVALGVGAPAGGLETSVQYPSAGPYRANGYRVMRYDGIGADQTWGMFHKTAGGQAVGLSDRRLEIWPRRVTQAAS